MATRILLPPSWHIYVVLIYRRRPVNNSYVTKGDRSSKKSKLGD